MALSKEPDPLIRVSVPFLELLAQRQASEQGIARNFSRQIRNWAVNDEPHDRLRDEQVVFLENTQRKGGVRFDEFEVKKFRTSGPGYKSNLRRKAAKFLREVLTRVVELSHDQAKFLLEEGANKKLAVELGLSRFADLVVNPIPPSDIADAGCSSSAGTTFQEFADQMIIEKHLQERENGEIIIQDSTNPLAAYSGGLEEATAAPDAGSQISTVCSELSRLPSGLTDKSALGSIPPLSLNQRLENLAQAHVDKVKKRTTTLGRALISEDQLAVLSRPTPPSEFTWKDVFRHICSGAGIAGQKTTAILTMMHEYQVTISKEDYVRTIPRTAETLLKVPKFDESKYPIRDVHGPSLNKGRVVKGRYIHFGLKDILLVKSAGLVNKWRYINTLRIIYVLFPNFLPLELIPMIEPKENEIFDKDIYQIWQKLPKPDPSKYEKDRLSFLIHGHIDGVEWFKNSEKSKAVPILGRLIGIQDMRTKKVIKIPILDPFVIGVMQVGIIFFENYSMNIDNRHEFY